jgi:hypothetical protein
MVHHAGHAEAQWRASHRLGLDDTGEGLNARDRLRAHHRFPGTFETFVDARNAHPHFGQQCGESITCYMFEPSERFRGLAFRHRSRVDRTRSDRPNGSASGRTCTPVPVLPADRGSDTRRSGGSRGGKARIEKHSIRREAASGWSMCLLGGPGLWRFRSLEPFRRTENATSAVEPMVVLVSRNMFPIVSTLFGKGSGSQARFLQVKDFS